jgi:hypothetical protein
MTLKVVGAGLGRTGTHSLKLALEQLLGAPCYHMLETFGKPDHVAEWCKAVHDENPDWDLIFDGYVATVDWPAASFYGELMEKYSDSIVLLSTRSDAEAWWTSASSTIFAAIDRVAQAAPDLELMILDLLETRFTPGWRTHDAAVAAYDRHNTAVRARVPADRLVEWQPGDSWGPLCRALGLDVPKEPFPHVNTTADFRAMTGLDS